MHTLQDELQTFLKIPLLFQELEGHATFDIPRCEKSNIVQNHEITLPSVLGKRLETLLSLHLKACETHKILHQNVQLIEHKNTLGELDFILETNEGQQIHVELACKFYLLDPSVSCNFHEQWIGPNRKDTLVKKINKLVHHQLPLLYANPTREKCSDINFKEIQQQICYKAFLFTPFKHIISNWENLNPKCWAGHYYSFKDFIDIDFPDTTVFYLPPKLEWFMEPSSKTEWKSLAIFKNELEVFIKKGRSPMGWMKNSEQEWQRFFVCSW